MESEIPTHEEVRVDSSDEIRLNNLRTENSSSAVAYASFTEVKSEENTRNAGKNMELDEVRKTELNLVASTSVDEGESSPLTLEGLDNIKFEDNECTDGEGYNFAEKGMNYSNLSGSDISMTEMPLNLTEAAIEVRPASRKCDAGKGVHLDKIVQNPFNLVSTFTASYEHSSSIIIPQSSGEIPCTDATCITEKDDNLGNGGNFSNTVSSDSLVKVNYTETDCNASNNSVFTAKTDSMEGGNISTGMLKVDVPDTAKSNSVVISIRSGDGALDSLHCDGEKICRICHLSSDRGLGTSDLMHLGCDCKDELGVAHRYCAETWFKIKGSRWCEICGECAKNITVVGDNRLMEILNNRMIGGIGGSNFSERGRYHRCQPFGNFLLACLVIAFILPWFFHVNMF